MQTMAACKKTGTASMHKAMDGSIYYFEFKDSKANFQLAVPGRADESKASPKPPIPAWARLGCHQCPICTLQNEYFKACPPAYEMAALVEQFANFNSFETVVLHLWKKSEHHSIETDLQRALAYVYPEIFAASACPFAQLLAPLHKFSKPFPYLDDFMFYALSFELIGAYLDEGEQREIRQLALDTDKTQTVIVIFQNLLRRIRQSSIADANSNALAIDVHWFCVTHQSQQFVRNRMQRYFSRQ